MHLRNSQQLPTRGISRARGAGAPMTPLGLRRRQAAEQRDPVARDRPGRPNSAAGTPPGHAPGTALRRAAFRRAPRSNRGARRDAPNRIETRRDQGRGGRRAEGLTGGGGGRGVGFWRRRRRDREAGRDLGVGRVRVWLTRVGEGAGEDEGRARE